MIPSTMVWPILFALATINGVAFSLMGWDKARALHAGRRIPERVFFLLAFASGAAGLWLGMVVFRHKTQTMSFQLVVPILVALHVATLVYLLR